MQLILSVLSDDKPGVVSALANAIAQAQASWLDSQLMRLAGKFAGVVCVEVAPSNQSALKSAINALINDGIRVLIDEDAKHDATNTHHAFFTVAAPDQKGLVLEFSQALASQGVSLVAIQSVCSSMPYSGDPLFSAKGKLAIPQGLSLADVEALLLKIADDLAMDVVVSAEQITDD